MELQPLYLKGLTPEMIKKAEIELGETPDVKAKALKELKQLIYNEPDFSPLTDDAFLIRFLRAKKYNVAIAFKTLRNYYAFKAKYSRIYTDFLPSETDRIMALNTIYVPLKRDMYGSDVIIGFFGSFDLDRYTLEEYSAAVLICAEVGINVEALQVCGCAAICDFKGITLKKLMHLASPSFLALICNSLQECVPYRLKAVHIVHEPPYFNFIYNIAKPLLSHKLKKRIYFHGNNLKGLHKFVPPEILPEELGGTQGPADNRKYREYLLTKEHLVARVCKSGQSDLIL